VVCKRYAILRKLKEDRPKIDRSVCSTLPHLSRRRPVAGGPHLWIIVQIAAPARHRSHDLEEARPKASPTDRRRPLAHLECPCPIVGGPRLGILGRRAASRAVLRFISAFIRAWYLLDAAAMHCERSAGGPLKHSLLACCHSVPAARSSEKSSACAGSVTSAKAARHSVVKCRLALPDACAETGASRRVRGRSKRLGACRAAPASARRSTRPSRGCPSVRQTAFRALQTKRKLRTTARLRFVESSAAQRETKVRG
jgi:hypothetical protein